MDIAISVGDSRKSTDWKTSIWTWEAFTDRLKKPVRTSETMEEYAQMSKEERANVKDVGGFVGGAIQGARKADNVKFRSLLTLDADYATDTFWDDITAVYDGACCMYSTHSYTKDQPRLRLVMPLTHSVNNAEYEAVARKMAQELGILEQLDDTTYESNRLMYWPSASRDGAYIFEKQDGDAVDPDRILARYENWHDVSQWPRSSRVLDELREKGKKAGDPLEKPGLIGAFCRVHTVEDALDTYLPDHFRKEADGRYSYIGGTTSCGVKIFDEGRFMYSWHAHDPYNSRLLNAFDVVRLHLFGHLDTNVKEDMPMSARQSYIAMGELLKGDKAVMDDLVMHNRDNNEGKDPADYTFRNQAQDMDVAQMIADRFRGKLMYHESLRWICWDGTRWKPDDLAGAMNAQYAFYNELLQDALDNLRTAMDPLEKKVATEVLKKVQAMRNTGKITGVERLLRTKLPLSDPDLLDPDPWVLNTPEGEVDLKTGEMHPHNPEHMCSHITKVSPEPGPSPMWQKFLDEATCGDRGLRDYMQMVAGMAAVGQVYEEGMVIVYGPGGNGKSTMFETLMHVLGGYATTIRSSVLVERKNADQPFGLDAARGRRMILMGELDEGVRLSVSTVKSLTSRDVIQANPKGKPLFTFQPTHKLILHTNHLPKLGQLDDGTRRRVSVVPFNAPMKTGKDRIPDLSERMIKAEGPQILQWIIVGARRFWENGCSVPKPAAVAEATEEYIRSEDWLANFFEEFCTVDKDDKTLKVSSTVLYNAYRQWAERDKEFVRSHRLFTSELERRGYVHTKTRTGAFWLGIGMNDEIV